MDLYKYKYVCQLLRWSPRDDPTDGYHGPNFYRHRWSQLSLSWCGVSSCRLVRLEWVA